MLSIVKKNKNESNEHKQNLLDDRVATTEFTDESSNKGGEIEVTVQKGSIEEVSVQTQPAENPSGKFCIQYYDD